MSLRCFGGGLHFNHYISCLIASFAFLFGSISLSMQIIPSKMIACASTLLCAFIGYLLVPITSTNRPPANSIQKRKSKRNTTVIILFYFILIYFCPTTPMLYICYWTVILHILQLIIAYIARRRYRNV